MYLDDETVIRAWRELKQIEKERGEKVFISGADFAVKKLVLAAMAAGYSVGRTDGIEECQKSGSS